MDEIGVRILVSQHEGLPQRQPLQYPQETLGHTLFETDEAGDYRRVFVRNRQRCTEVAEFMRGPVATVAYGTKVYSHGIHVGFADQPAALAMLQGQEGLAGLGWDESLASYFTDGSRLLVDLMDDLDVGGVPYGYLSTTPGLHVSYRPVRATAGEHSHRARLPGLGRTQPAPR